jgi:hypothetical protein
MEPINQGGKGRGSHRAPIVTSARRKSDKAGAVGRRPSSPCPAEDGFEEMSTTTTAIALLNRVVKHLVSAAIRFSTKTAFLGNQLPIKTCPRKLVPNRAFTGYLPQETG